MDFHSKMCRSLFEALDFHSNLPCSFEEKGTLLHFLQNVTEIQSVFSNTTQMYLQKPCRMQENNFIGGI